MTNEFETFPAHLFIDVVYGNKKHGGFIYEQTVPIKEKYIIQESFGVFSGCEDIAERVFEECGHLQNNGSDRTIIICGDNLFIKTIFIKLVESSTGGFSTKSKIDRDNKYNPLIITIPNRLVGKNELKPLIMHELTHAYENYNRIKNKADDIQDVMDKIGYEKNPPQDSIKYTANKRAISSFLYFMTNFEQNAYIAQICGQFEECKETFWDVNEAMMWVREHTLYRQYNNLFNIGEALCTIKGKSLQEEILTYVNELSRREFIRYSDFVRWLKNKLFKSRKKFDRTISNYISQKIEMYGVMAHPTNENDLDNIVEEVLKNLKSKY